MGLGEAIAGGASQFIGSLYQDYRNRKSVNRAQDFAAGMANTSYQRAVKDLRKAGLNPMLAYTQGGAASPGGEAMSVDAPDVGKGVSTALETMMFKENLKKLQSETALNTEMQETQKKLAAQYSATARAIEAEIPLKQAQGETGKILTDGIRKTREKINSVREGVQKGFDKGVDTYHSVKDALMDKKLDYEDMKSRAKVRLNRWNKKMNQSAKQINMDWQK